ncbi:hypothetical protein MMC20_002243 [Loxospora ochrophaea]|nr:hypothetical protein [Loxospora ochrophaea]
MPKSRTQGDQAKQESKQEGERHLSKIQDGSSKNAGLKHKSNTRNNAGRHDENETIWQSSASTNTQCSGHSAQSSRNATRDDRNIERYSALQRWKDESPRDQHWNSAGYHAGFSAQRGEYEAGGERMEELITL